MILLLFLISAGPGSMWLDALSEAPWADEYALGLSASQASVSYTGMLPNPVLQFSLAGSQLETRNGPVLGSIGFQQKIPWPGLLSASRDVAEASFSVAEANREMQELHMRTLIAQAWADVYRTGERQRISQETAVLMGSLLASATGASSSLAMEQSALADLRVRTAIAEQKPLLEENLFQVSLGELEALTGITVPRMYTVPSPEWFTDRIASADVNSPLLAAAFASVVSSEAGLSRAKALRMPDFVAGVSYSPIGNPEIEGGAVSPGRDSWMVSAGITLPLGYSGDGARIQEAEYALAGARAHLLQKQGEIQAALTSRRIQAENIVEELILLSEVLPLSESAVLSASQSWVSGRGSYGTLISALQNNLAIQMTIVEKEALLVSTTAGWLELAGAVTDEGEFL